MKKLLILFLLTISICNGLKILNIFHTTSKSHDNLGKGINRHLLNAGHEVTYITAFPEKNPHPKLRQIDVTSNLELLPDDKQKKITINPNLFLTYEVIMFVMYKLTTMTIIENDNVQKLLKDPNEHFDIVICDWVFDEILISGLANLYDAPLIWVSSLDPHWGITSYIDEPLHPAYSSEAFSDATVPFTFWQRAKELWTLLRVTFYKETIFHFFDARSYTNLIAPLIESRGKNPPSPQELRYNASLVLSNSHVSFGDATRLPINYISLGGFHIDDDVKPLPHDLQKLMDNAKHGVIYFSMGSLLLSKDLSEEVRTSLIKMFSTLKQTVIWKYEDELSNLPENLYIVKWAPQQSILNHPNCVLFITHGGLLSTTEAIHFGVPIVGMPVFADQFTNIAKAVKRGFAKKVEMTMKPTVADDLKIAILEVLWNPKYKEKVDELSFIFHHRPLKPGVELVHWVEHVAKTRGAPHMRSPALSVSWYQKTYLDLAAVILLIVFTLRFLYSKLWSSKKVDCAKKVN